MKDLNFCTIATKNRLAHAKVLVDSLLTHHPEAQIFLLIVDKIDNFFDPSALKEKMELINARSLKNVPNITEMFFKFNSFEASTVLKPFFIEYLLKTYNMRKLVYLDSDIYVTMNMNELNDLLGDFSIILTPHITKELPQDGLYPNELTFLKEGSFNTGFIGVANESETLSFLSWWGKRLWHFGLYNPAQGMFADQKWIDLMPCLFEEVHILKDPGYNVAYWNLHERKLSVAGGKILANGEVLRFFHFSGFEPDNIEGISKHQTRYKLVHFPHVQPLFELYKKLLVENGYNEIRTWPYSYDFFANGVKIPDHARRVYWELGNRAKIFANPFKTDKKDAFLEYYLKNFSRLVEYLDKIISFGKRYKKFVRKFPRLEMLARKFLKFRDFFANEKDADHTPSDRRG